MYEQPVRGRAASATAAADPADDQNRDEDPEADRHRKRRRIALARRRLRRGHAIERDAAPLRDPLNDARRAGEQADAELAGAELRRHAPARFAGEAVGDELLEVVPDFDLDARFLHREQDQQPVVLALLPDAAPAVLEHLDGVFLGRGVRRDGRHRGDDDDVARLGLQLPDDLLHPPRAVGVDHVREVVDRLRQLGGKRRRLRAGRTRENQNENENENRNQNENPEPRTLNPEPGRVTSHDSTRRRS